MNPVSAHPMSEARSFSRQRSCQALLRGSCCCLAKVLLEKLWGMGSTVHQGSAPAYAPPESSWPKCRHLCIQELTLTSVPAKVAPTKPGVPPCWALCSWSKTGTASYAAEEEDDRRQGYNRNWAGDAEKQQSKPPHPQQHTQPLWFPVVLRSQSPYTAVPQHD